jgi:hypothetical protein
VSSFDYAQDDIACVFPIKHDTLGGMSHTYHTVLQYAFRRFSVLTASRTALPTFLYYASRPAFPLSEKPALCTMNILPPLVTLWHHCVRKFLGDTVDVWIFDCSGELSPRDFPGARVQKFLNLYAATKCEEFLYSIARHRRIGWICDDDMFLLSPNIMHVLEREFAVPGTASVSFRPRPWWHFAIAGNIYAASSSYCTAIDRKIFCDKECLSLRPTDGNTHPNSVGKKLRRYDTFDKANEILITRGYRCAVIPEEERNGLVAGFSGISGGVMLLKYFKTPEQTLDYFESPPKECWRGNMLHGVLAAMLGISVILELAEKVSGKRHSLPSLPQRSELERIRREHARLMPKSDSLQWMDETAQQLREAL